MKCGTRRFGKVVKMEDWAAEHNPHGEPKEVDADVQPPSYRLYYVVCPCGAKILCNGPKEQSNVDSTE